MKVNFFLLLFFAVPIISTAQNEKPVMIVELFTSEGCSSCPPADKLLSEIVRLNDKSVEVIGLSFHVDYWDYIGWKDPYASNDFTIRQRAYARKLGSESVYTPQMIVNGKHVFVGSNRPKWNALYKSEGRIKTTVNLQVLNASIDKGYLTFKVKSEATNSQINVALVERGMSQNVTQGENQGKILSHDNVVKVYNTRRFDGKLNTFSMKIPQDLKLKNTSLVVYSQNNQTWNINGAKKIDLISIIN